MDCALGGGLWASPSGPPVQAPRGVGCVQRPSREHKRPAPRFAFGPSRRSATPPVIRPLLTSPRRATPSRASPSLPTRRTRQARPGIPGHPQRPPRVRPATFIAHPPRLRNGPLMTSGFASWCRLAQTAPPSTRGETRPQTIPPRHVFLGSRLRTPASSPPSLTTERLPSACGWCHQPPQGTRTPELLVMSCAHRT